MPWNWPGYTTSCVSTPSDFSAWYICSLPMIGTLKSFSPPRYNVGVLIRSAWKKGYEIFSHRSRDFQGNPIWGGLWALPEFPTRAHAEQWCREHLKRAGEPLHAEPVRHAFSHFDYEMRPLVVRCAGKSDALRADDRYRWYDVRDPLEVGLPKPNARLIERTQETDA